MHFLTLKIGLLRFIGLNRFRGVPGAIFLDNATQFVAASKRISVTWHFITPKPHGMAEYTREWSDP